MKKKQKQVIGKRGTFQNPKPESLPFSSTSHASDKITVDSMEESQLVRELTDKLETVSPSSLHPPTSFIITDLAYFPPLLISCNTRSID